MLTTVCRWDGEEHLCYSKQLLVLLVQYKPTTYNRTFKKKKQNPKMLKCHNPCEMEKAKACFLFLPLWEFNARYREEPQHKIKDGCSSSLPISWSFVLLQSTACMQKALQALVHRPWDTAFARGQMRFHSSSESVLEIQCIHSAVLWESQEQNSYVLSIRRQNTPIWMHSMFGVAMW